MTIDAAKLRSLARYQNDAVITAEEITELLDAYEERDRLRTALAYYAEPRNHHDDYLHTNDSYDDLKLPGSRARAALEGRE